ncbi:MAG: sigma-70 family RNA polymerase sigma factor [Candidatus Hodgkinia cicadicola]
MQNAFLQFSTLLVLASAKNLETLKPRCVRIKENFSRLNQALSALEALRQTKVELVELNQRLVSNQISLYFRPKVMPSALLLAGKRGLVKAINRFDFDYPIHFASYARFWVKHELLKKPALPRPSALLNQPIITYTFGDIGLWPLIELANGTTTLPPKVSLTDLQVRTKNVREVYSALSLLSPRERRMLMLRCCRPKRTFLSIGEEYKLSKERVRQLCNRSIKRLKSTPLPVLNVEPLVANSVLFQIDTSKSVRRSHWPEVRLFQSFPLTSAPNSGSCLQSP